VPEKQDVLLSADLEIKYVLMGLEKKVDEDGAPQS
jgi:hypothetical protein